MQESNQSEAVMEIWGNTGPYRPVRGEREREESESRERERLKLRSASSRDLDFVWGKKDGEE